MPKPRGKKPQPAPAPTKPLAERLLTPRVLCLAFALAVLVFYFKPLFDSNASIQWDAVDVHYSAQRYFAAQLHAGHLPFWTPHVFSGMPFLADPQVGAWYPLNWPFFALGITPRSIEWELALHCLLALAGTYLLTRALHTGRAAALFAAIAYAFAGFFTGNSSHIAGFQAAALLPWLLWTGHRATESRRFLPALAAVAGLVVLAGHFQIALYSFAALAIFLLARGLTRPTVIALACAAVAAFTIPAIMILPGLELTAQSERAVVAFAQSNDGVLVPSALVTLVSPNHYGAADVENYTGPRDVTQFYFYQGILLLPLAIAAVYAARRNLLTLAVPLALLLFALWYALGRSWGLYSLTALLPGFKNIRAPVNCWFVASLALALLAAAGLQSLRTRFPSPWIPIAVLAIAFADLYYWNMDRNGLAYQRDSFATVYGAAEARFHAFAAPFARDPIHRLHAAIDSPGFGPLNAPLDLEMETTYGYNPLQLLRYQAYFDAARNNHRLVDALAATAELNLQNGLFAPDQQSLPRFYAPDTALAAQSRDDAASRLAALDPAHQTLVEGLASPMPANAGAQFQIESYTGDAYRVRYQATKPTLVRIAVPYFPGWHAEVDGQPTDLLPADLALMAAMVPAGAHTLTLHYRSTHFALGATISILAYAVVGISAFALRGRR